MHVSNAITRNLVTIGGSAGSYRPLRAILSRIRPDLPASILVVQHIPAGHPSSLADHLDASGSLPAVMAQDGMQLQPGHVYVGPPDRHLMVDSNGILVRHGPKENRCRPAIDPLFRSAAAHFDGRVIAVLLSGYLTDGASGLTSVQRCGGLTVVQDPDDADVEEMPRYAIEHMTPDYIVDSARIADLLNELAGQPAQKLDLVPKDIRLEADMAAGKQLSIGNEYRLGTPSPIACPECNGNLWEIEDQSILRYRCHVGHAYTAEEVGQAQGDELDTALWSAYRILHEQAALKRRLADREFGESRSRSGSVFSRSADELEQQAATLLKYMQSHFEPASDYSPDRETAS